MKEQVDIKLNLPIKYFKVFPKYSADKFPGSKVTRGKLQYFGQTEITLQDHNKNHIVLF